MKHYDDSRNRCATCTHHFGEHDKMTGPCRAVYWVRDKPRTVCECNAFVRVTTDTVSEVS